jgi:hypothetical protein
MKLLNEPTMFSEENVKKIEDLKNAKFVCETEQNGLHVAIFYADEAHPDSGSRYFGLYYTGVENQLMITNGAFIEEQNITGVVAENGDVIYSRYRHDYRRSPDDTVFVDGGRAYLRTNSINTVNMVVKEGILEVE